MLAVVALSCFSFAISSEEAAAKAKPYLDSSMAPLPNPFFVRSEYYFVYAPSIYSSKRIFIAVSDRTGEIETDKERLSALGAGVYDYGILSEYITRNKVSFGDMQTTVRQTSIAIDRNLNSLEALASRTQQSYPDSNFDDLDAKALKLQRSAQELDSLVGDGVGLQKQFENDFSDISLSGVLEYYRNTFAKASEFIVDYDNYNNAISQKQTEVFKSSIPAPDNENIVKSLENMRLKVDLFETLRYLKPSEGMLKLEAAKDDWVNDSLASFAYKKLTVDAQTKYNELKPQIESVYYGEASLQKCGLGDEADSIKSRWQSIQALFERGRASDFQTLPAKLDALSAQYEELNGKYQACISPQSQLVPSDSGSTQNNYVLPLVLLALLAGAGYYVWRYKQSQEETYK